MYPNRYALAIGANRSDLRNAEKGATDISKTLKSLGYTVRTLVGKGSHPTPRLEPSAHWTFIAQYLDGDTAVGADSSGAEQFYMKFRAYFALGSFEWARERITARYDDFHTHQLSGFFGPPSNDAGRSWTFAWSHECGDDWQFVAEWLRVASRFPPRVALDEPAAIVESQFQLAVRYRFQFSW